MRQKDFARILGRIMKRPSWLPVPSFMLRLYLGEMAEEMLLSGQRVKPRRLLEAGYRFLYPQAELAIKEILGKNA
jgi:NAD dependent epimerase/dehydratase family enzyme